MYLQVKIAENGRKKVFWDEQTTKKVALIFSDFKVLTERYQWAYWTM